MTRQKKCISKRNGPKKIKGVHERQKVKAIYEDDIKDLLTKLGILNKIEKNKMECPFCGQNISVQNVGILYKKQNKILIACNNTTCISSARMDIEE